jgi:hypothetical protein
MVGAMTLARAVDDRELSTEILEATLADINARDAGRPGGQSGH